MKFEPLVVEAIDGRRYVAEFPQRIVCAYELLFAGELCAVSEDWRLLRFDFVNGFAEYSRIPCESEIGWAGELVRSEMKVLEGQ